MTKRIIQFECPITENTLVKLGLHDAFNDLYIQLINIYECCYETALRNGIPTKNLRIISEVEKMFAIEAKKP